MIHTYMFMTKCLLRPFITPPPLNEYLRKCAILCIPSALINDCEIIHPQPNLPPQVRSQNFEMGRWTLDKIRLWQKFLRFVINGAN